MPEQLGLLTTVQALTQYLDSVTDKVSPLQLILDTSGLQRKLAWLRELYTSPTKRGVLSGQRRAAASYSSSIQHFKGAD